MSCVNNCIESINQPSVIKINMNSLVTKKCYNTIYLCINTKYHSIQLVRSLSTSSVLYGKRNFRKFLYFERGTPLDHEWFRNNPDKVDQRGMRLPGYWKDKKLVHVPEMVPELVVPDLSGFKLKPYVSYRTTDIVQEKITPEHLFYAVYAKKIKNDFEQGKLDENGNPLEPSEHEKLTAEEAWTKAKSTGSDLFG